MERVFAAATRLMAAAVAVFLLAPAGPALAVGEDVFVVPRVPVQAQADSAAGAKAAAQDMGRRRAMDILLRRLTVSEDWVFLPRLAAGEPAQASARADRSPIALTPRDLETLESGFEVYAEKSSATTYRAFITYRFKPDAVRRLLKNARLPYSETQTRTALVIPVLQTANGLYLWEENNPWMAAWKARPYVNELTPMTAPLGDLEDAARLSARQALDLNAAALEATAHHYSVSQVIVAHARLTQQGGQDRLSVRLISAFRETGAGSPAEIDPAFGDLDAAGYDAASDAPQEIVSRVGEVLAEVTASDASGNFSMLAESAIENAMARYGAAWKARTLIDHSVEQILPASAFFSSMNDWNRIRTALAATPIVNSVQVFALSPKGAEMRLKVFGDPSRLAAAMDAYGVDFWSEDGQHWLLATPALSRSLKGNRLLRQRRGMFGDTETMVGDPRLERASQPAETTNGSELKIDQRY